MEHSHEHTSTVKREIPKANTGHIWRTFWILLAITIVEVGVGMFHLLPKGIMLNVFFIVLTLVKAFYIVAEFMHLGHEVKFLAYCIVLPMAFLMWFLVVGVAEGNFYFLENILYRK